MLWLLDHFQVVVLLALAVAAMVKRRIDQATVERATRRNAGKPMDQKVVLGPLEAWPPGEPIGPPPPFFVNAGPPPPYVGTGLPPLVCPAPVPAKPAELAESAAILKRQLELQEALRRINASKTTTTIIGGAAATSKRVLAAQHHHNPGHFNAKTALSSSLRHRKDLRRAIVVREILGPPHGLP